MYRAGAGADIGAWDGVLAVLGVEVISINAFLGWFDLAKACWAFLWEWEFDAIVVELKQVVQMFDRNLMICKMFD